MILSRCYYLVTLLAITKKQLRSILKLVLTSFVFLIFSQVARDLENTEADEEMGNIGGNLNLGNPAANKRYTEALVIMRS